MSFPSYVSLLQYDSPDEPPLLDSGATFVRFPDGLASFCLDVVKGLREYKLVQMEHNGVWRLSVRTPKGNTLTPLSSQDRGIQCRVDGKQRYFNVMNLLASVLLGRDVTGTEYAILVVEGGMRVESKQDRERLRDERKKEAVDLPRKELTIIPRSKSETIDVTGQGYYVQGGKIYRKYGKALAVAKNGRCSMTDCRGTRLKVHVGWVLFTAYPEFYRFDADVHQEVDHIDGDHKNNAPNNFRPVTKRQNCTLRQQTGSRMERPGPDSSYEQCKRKFGTLSKDKTDRISAEDLKQYEETWYWVHRLGTVFVRQSDETFRYAEASVRRDGYVVSGGHKHHLMVMKVFGKYIKGMVVMHEDDNKQHNGFDNLRMGTKQDNACRTNGVTIHRPGEDPRRYRSYKQAARTTGVSISSLRSNGKRNLDSPELRYSKTRKGVRFACVDDFSPFASSS